MTARASRLLAKPASCPVAINRDRFAGTLHGLAQIGADPSGGICRLGLSPEEGEARRFLGDLAQRAGLTATADPAGNLLIRRPRPDPAVPVLMFGSHLDSVRRGGWLDGAYGVVAALEALTVLTETGAPGRFEPVAVGLANEEGALVQCPFWGSRAITGTLGEAARHARDRRGRPAGELLRAVGGDIERVPEAAWAPGRVAAFLELHIEQGPVLERRGIAIGVVDRIVGRTVLEFEIKGEQRHAGTTPMGQRRDALVIAARLVARVESIATELGACATATVGFLEAEPNTTNTIPGTVRLTAEIRDPDPARLQSGETLLNSIAAHVARESGAEVRVGVSDRSAPVATDPALRAVIRGAADSLGLSSMAMPSGAGHDAQVMAAIAPVGVIFVPSKAGISHAPGEDTDLPELIAGANVLLAALVALQQGARHDTLGAPHHIDP
jgi:N-carbamoyl-L-amino-acid hydrolase